MKPHPLRLTGPVGLLIAATLSVGAPVESATDGAYRDAHFGDLPFEVPLTLAGGHILVDGVYVNDQGPFRFLLDTGAMGGGPTRRLAGE